MAYALTARMLALVGLLLLLIGACAGYTRGPSLMPPWSVSGLVRDNVTGRGIKATITVVDGPNAGKSTTSNGHGYYTIENLGPGALVLRARRKSYGEVTMGITLNSNRS